MNRRGTQVATAAVLVLVAALGWWSGRATLASPAADASASSGRTTVTVVDGTVGRSIPVGVTVLQPVRAVAANHLSGVVTAVSQQARVQEGDVLFEVAGTPVRAVEGEVPFYRPLATGVEGRDVPQLQRMLADGAHLAVAQSGRFDARTAAAVMAWQRAVGAPVTGIVALGELVAVPALPAVLRPGPAVQTGALLTGGEPAVLGGTGERTFILVLSEEQGASVTPDTRIRVQHAGKTWQAKVTSSSTDENGQTIRVLAATVDGPVCGADCAGLPADEKFTLRGDAVLVPEVDGPTVPAAAVRTGADGRSYVRMDDGSRRDVDVRGGGQGLVVVDGLRAGERVVLEAPPAATAGRS